MYFDQREFDVRCEWGESGVTVLAPISDVVVIVDVLSFSTCVDIAIAREATVFPYQWKDESAAQFAATINGQLADPRRTKGKYSLSPESLMHISPGTRIVLPSPNGAALTLKAKPTPVLAGCLRNARAVALAAKRYGTKFAIIPAGERWKDDHSLRPSFEDLLGAGAIIRHLTDKRSPEAVCAVAAFQEAQPLLGDYLRQSSSGKELIGRGFSVDVDLSAQLDVSESVPVLVNGAFVKAEP
jgi:2-phosphosulfolactate phosphatase